MSSWGRSPASSPRATSRGRSESDLRPLIVQARAVLLHCQTTPEEVERRIVTRSGAGDRHAGHHDTEALPNVLEGITKGIFDPLDLPLPVLRIDTTDGYDPALPDIVRFVREA